MHYLSGKGFVLETRANRNKFSDSESFNPTIGFDVLGLRRFKT